MESSPFVVGFERNDTGKEDQLLHVQQPEGGSGSSSSSEEEHNEEAELEYHHPITDHLRTMSVQQEVPPVLAQGRLLSTQSTSVLRQQGDSSAAVLARHSLLGRHRPSLKEQLQTRAMQVSISQKSLASESQPSPYRYHSLSTNSLHPFPSGITRLASAAVMQPVPERPSDPDHDHQPPFTNPGEALALTVSEPPHSTPHHPLAHDTSLQQPTPPETVATTLFDNPAFARPQTLQMPDRSPTAGTRTLDPANPTTGTPHPPALPTALSYADSPWAVPQGDVPNVDKTDDDVVVEAAVEEDSKREPLHRAQTPRMMRSPPVMGRMPVSADGRISTSRSSKILALEASYRKHTAWAFYCRNRRVDVGAPIKYMLWDIWLPDDPMRTCWDLLMLLCMVYVMYVTPYIVAFEISTSDLSADIARLDLAINALFLTDVLLNFRTAYHTSDGILITDRKRVARTYLKTWFLPDLLTSLPYDNMFGDELGVLKALRLVRVARFVRVLRMLKRRRFRKVAEQFTRHHFMRLLLFGVFSASICHWMACIFYLVAASYPDDVETWISKYHDLGTPYAERYLDALYWAVTTMTTTGYGDITPKTAGEKVFTMFAMVTGASFFAYFMGAMAAVVATMNITEARIAQKKTLMNEFLKKRKIPKRLSKRIRNFFMHVLEKQLHREEAELIAELPNSLRMQVTCHLNREAVERVPWLRGRSPAFITALVQQMKLECYHPEEVIVRQGNMGLEMYFISTGTLEVRNYHDGGSSQADHKHKYGKVRQLLRRKKHKSVVLLDEDLTNMMYDVEMILGPGEYFGEHACMLGLPYERTIVAQTFSEVYSLSRPNLELVANQWPELADDILDLFDMQDLSFDSIMEGKLSRDPSMHHVPTSEVELSTMARAGSASLPTMHKAYSSPAVSSILTSRADWSLHGRKRPVTTATVSCQVPDDNGQQNTTTRNGSSQTNAMDRAQPPPRNQHTP